MAALSRPRRIAGSLAAFLSLSLASPRGEAEGIGSIPFYGSESAFLKSVSEGQLDPQLEIHLLQYSADTRWAIDWAASRATGYGFFGEFGSTTARRLYANAEVALNALPGERVQFRYGHRTYQDGRFDVRDDRISLLWYPGSAWAVILTGWPTGNKEDSVLGLGVRLGTPRGENGLELVVVDERFLWNQKAEGSSRFTAQPLRILADGYLGSGPWRVYLSVDYGLNGRVEEGLPDGGGSRSTEGYVRLGKLGAEYRDSSWAAGGRLFYASSHYAQGVGDRRAYALDRTYGQLQVYGRVESGAWAGYGLAAVGWQDDDFASTSVDDGSYGATSWLLGAEGGYAVGKRLQLRLGYLASVYNMERRARAETNVGDIDWNQAPNGYADKVHLRALYDFRRGVSIEILLSQTVSTSSFGGGSVKARFQF